MIDKTGSIPDASERSGLFVAIAKYFYMPVPIYLHLPKGVVNILNFGKFTVRRDWPGTR